MCELSKHVEFIDNTRVHLSTLTTCVCALYHLAPQSDNPSLEAVADSLDFATDSLKELFDRYWETFKREDEEESEGTEHE